MAIRTNTNPRQMDLQPEMRNMLMRNGLQAHVALDGSGYRLIVQGHDSPLLVYPISELTDWGTNTANKKAYNVLTSIVGKDFYMPKNFVHARNANGRVAMGLHGYRIGIGEYGRMGRMNAPAVPRLDATQPVGLPPAQGRRPTVLSGAVHRTRTSRRAHEARRVAIGRLRILLQGASTSATRTATVITPIVSRPRSGEPARPYKELIASPVYFSNEKWAECLASHGLVVDAERRTLTVQSESVQADMVYDLTEEEVRTLVATPIEEQPVEKRLELLNGIIGADFSDKVTMEALNSDQRIAIGLHPEVQQDLEQRQRQEQEAFMPVETSLQQQEESIQGEIGASVDGRDLQFLNENKGWYREEKHGREVEVSQIAVQPAQTEGKYRMTAVIDGQAISHEITQRDYDKFLAVDDYHRMKLFSKIFSEVDMKTRPEAQRGLGTKIFAALTAGTVVAAGVAHGIHHHCHAPEFYGECFGGPPRPYIKLGVDTPRDMAIRCFEAEMNREINDMRMGR